MGKARDLARVIVDSSGLIAAGNLGNAVPADGSITSAKIADGAVVTADIADNAVSASKLLSSDWARSLSGTGYQRLAGGVIIQWGAFTQNNVTDLAITFPVAYPNTVGFVIVAMNTRTGGADMYVNGVLAYGVATNGFTSHNRVDSNNNTFRWISVGY